MIDKSFDLNSNHLIINFYNSFVFGIMVVYMTDDKKLTQIEKDDMMISITILVFSICELEYMGFL
jgi:hypothetical protein